MKSISIAAAALWATVALAEEPPAYSKHRTMARFYPEAAHKKDYLDGLGYQNFKVGNGDKEAGFTADDGDGLKFAISTEAESGLVGGVNWDVYQSDPASEAQRMVGAGIAARDGENITMRIDGLPAGNWSLQTFHNAWNELESIPTVAVNIDGHRKISGREQSAQADSLYTSEATFAYFQSHGDRVYITWAPSGGNIYLNGFELDNDRPGGVGREIQRPSPGNHAESVKTDDDGAVEVTWNAPANEHSAEYNIYFGTNSNNLQEHYKGSTKTSATFPDLESHMTYYWRVDTVETFYGDVFSGRIMKFSTE